MKMRAYMGPVQIVILATAVLLSVTAVITCIIFVAGSGGEIPVKIDEFGDAPETASAGEMLLLPIILLIVNLTMALFLMIGSTSLVSMPCKVTEKNAFMLYRSAATLIALIAFIFGLMSLLGVILLFTARDLAGTVMVIGTVALMVIAAGFFVGMMVAGNKNA